MNNPGSFVCASNYSKHAKGLRFLGWSMIEPSGGCGQIIVLSDHLKYVGLVLQVFTTKQPAGETIDYALVLVNDRYAWVPVHDLVKA